MKLLEFLETIDFIENKEQVIQDLSDEGIENPNIIDICSLIYGISTLEFLYDLHNITIPKEYINIVKDQIKLIISDWNNYSDSIHCDDYLSSNDDLTKVYREYKIDENDDEEVYEFDTFTIKFYLFDRA